jgi:hypothetical protein
MLIGFAHGYLPVKKERDQKLTARSDKCQLSAGKWPFPEGGRRNFKFQIAGLESSICDFRWFPN